MSAPSSGVNTSDQDPEGVELILEACDEWKIQEIGYDGVEKYIRPETFTDNVGRLARKVEWAKLVESDVDYDNAQIDNGMDLDDENVAKRKENNDDVNIPEVGPWSNVAKQLHEALQQLNVLLDDFTIMKSTDYMKPLTVLEPATSTDDSAAGKSEQWIWRRRALQEASVIMGSSLKKRQLAASNIGLTDDYISHVQRTQFFDELKIMREMWRVRKTGDHIYGDLSYNIFGSKYETSNLFDISRRQLNDQMTKTKCPIIEVSVPKDLARRCMLSVSYHIDNSDPENAFGEEETIIEEVSDFDKSKQKWKDSLRWAQNTLLLRDTFNMICKDAIKLRNRVSTIRGNVLLVNLFENVMLRIELKYYPFESGCLKEEGEPFLNRALRELFIGFTCTKFLRPQMFITLPITHLPEALDRRGSMAFSKNEIDEKAIKPKSVLERLLEIAGHYYLVRMTSNVAHACSQKHVDPTVQHRFLHAGRRKSTMVVHCSSRDFEPHLGNMRTAFYVEITATDVVVESKDGIVMKCQRNTKDITYAFDYCIGIYCLNTVASIARNNWATPFQIMGSNIYGLDKQNNPSPYIIVCNLAATRTILFTFPPASDPNVYVSKFKTEHNAAIPIDRPWRQLNYQKLYGSTFCKKETKMNTYIILALLVSCALAQYGYQQSGQGYNSNGYQTSTTRGYNQQYPNSNQYGNTQTTPGYGNNNNNRYGSTQSNYGNTRQFDQQQQGFNSVATSSAVFSFAAIAAYALL